MRTTDYSRLEAITGDLAALDVPALVAWTTDDRMMPKEHGPRLAELLPHGHYVEVADSRTLVQLDQPAVLAGLVRDFIRNHPVQPEASHARQGSGPAEGSRAS